MINLNNGDLYHGDSSEILSNFDSNSIDCVVTSPPYDDLRHYDGKSWSHDVFTNIADQLSRVLKPGGVIVWNVNDATIKGGETGTSFRQALYFIDHCDLLLHDTMIWRKSNFSNPSSTRYHQVFEYMFIFSKGKPKSFNPIKDRKNVYGGKKGSFGKNTSRQADGSFVTRNEKINDTFGMRHNVWDMNTAGQNQEKHNHPAVFPLQLANDHILSWSNEGDTVLDPFMGSGTTAIAAIQLNRKWIGIESNIEYINEAIKRISDV